MGCNCNKKKNSPVIEGLQKVATATAQGALNSMVSIVDQEFEMIVYMHPNKGQHPVIGPATRNNYGFRAGGGSERFLVHRSDIAASPGYFQIVSAVPAAPKIVAPPPPPPVSLVEPKEDLGEPRESIANDIKVDIIDSVRFDLQLLPGATPNLARNLSDANLRTPKDILAAGIDGLKTVKGIGDSKAEAIYIYVKDRYTEDN